MNKLISPWLSSLFAQPFANGSADSRFSVRFQVALILSWLSRITLGGMVLLIPFRYRFRLFSQPIPPLYRDYTNGLIFVSDLFLIATLGLWGASLALNPRKISWGPLFISLPLAGLVLVSLISLFTSINLPISAYHLGRLALLGGLYLYVINEIRELKWIAWPVAGQVAIQASVGILQVLRQHSLGLKFLEELELDPTWSGVSIVWAEGVRSLRAYGLSDHPNILGGCLAFGLILLATWYMSGISNRGIVLAGAFFAGMQGLLLTFSRSAWLGLIVGLLVVSVLFWRSGKSFALSKGFYLLAACLIVSLPLLGYSAPLLGVRLNQEGSFQTVATENRSLSERASLNAAANEIFASQALTGVGLGTAPLALLQAKPDFPFNYQPPHNVLLDAAVETGILGATVVFILMVGPWVLLWVRRKRLAFSPFLIGASGALAAVTIVGLFDYYPWMLAPGLAWQWLIWALWAAAYQGDLGK